MSKTLNPPVHELNAYQVSDHRRSYVTPHPMALAKETQDKALSLPDRAQALGVVIQVVYVGNKNFYDSGNQAAARKSDNVTEPAASDVFDGIIGYVVNVAEETPLLPDVYIPDPDATDKGAHEILNTYKEAGFFRIIHGMSENKVANVGDVVYVGWTNYNAASGRKEPYYIGIQDVRNLGLPNPGAKMSAAGQQHVPKNVVDWKKLPQKHVVDRAKSLKTKGSELIEGVGYPEVVPIVQQEHSDWAKVGGKSPEKDPTMKEHIRKYWKSTKLSDSNVKSRVKNPSAEPWSAAYISWVMKDAGFWGATSHDRYSRLDSSRNHKSKNDAGHWEVFSLMNDYERIVIQVGDVLIQPRYVDGDYGIKSLVNKKVDGKVVKDADGNPVKEMKAVAKPAISHGDVVYRIDGGRAYLSGGNLDNTAKDTGRSLALTSNNTLKRLDGRGPMKPEKGFPEAYRRGDYVLILKRMETGAQQTAAAEEDYTIKQSIEVEQSNPDSPDATPANASGG